MAPLLQFKRAPWAHKSCIALGLFFVDTAPELENLEDKVIILLLDLPLLVEILLEGFGPQVGDLHGLGLLLVNLSLDVE